MAGAAVAPALGIIKAHFADVNQLLVQMIISMPALFIVLTNLIFPKLSAKYKSRSLLLFGLLLYTVGGSLAGVFDNIYIVLIFRALVGIGVGIIMPMSTGLLSFYYTRIVAPLMFAVGYAALAFIGGWAGAICGSIFVGFANGLGIPFIISTASKKAGKSAASTVMPLLSAALYLAQFLTPMILSPGNLLFIGVNAAHLPYCIALLFAILLTLWSFAMIREDMADKHIVRQEA